MSENNNMCNALIYIKDLIKYYNLLEIPKTQYDKITKISLKISKDNVDDTIFCLDFIYDNLNKIKKLIFVKKYNDPTFPALTNKFALLQELCIIRICYANSASSVHFKGSHSSIYNRKVICNYLTNMTIINCEEIPIIPDEITNLTLISIRNIQMKQLTENLGFNIKKLNIILEDKIMYGDVSTNSGTLDIQFNNLPISLKKINIIYRFYRCYEASSYDKTRKELLTNCKKIKLPHSCKLNVEFYKEDPQRSFDDNVDFCYFFWWR